MFTVVFERSHCFESVVVDSEPSTTRLQYRWETPWRVLILSGEHREIRAGRECDSKYA